MASVRQHGKGFRAEVFRRGERKARTFDSESEARTWAANLERSIESRYQRRIAAENALAFTGLPEQVLHAVANIPYGRDEIVKSAIPVVVNCGVYFLIDKGRIIYVGQSINVMARVSRHLREDKGFDSFAVVTCKREELDKTEEMYLMALMPRLNKRIELSQ